MSKDFGLSKLESFDISSITNNKDIYNLLYDMYNHKIAKFISDYFRNFLNISKLDINWYVINENDFFKNTIKITWRSIE